MDLTHLIRHPESLNKATLFELRSLVSLHPYYQPARLLLLRNLYLLHDPTFDEELRRAAVYITDRRVLFDLVEAAHYRLGDMRQSAVQTAAETGGDRTMSLIDNFLESLPEEEEAPQKTKRRKPTPADATVDYVAYLLQYDNEETPETDTAVPEMTGQALIDDFLTNKSGKMKLKETPEYVPQLNDDKQGDEGIFTETLALIYIKQGRYSKALEIIKRLNLNYPKKSSYFADQIRFLEKLIINNNYKK